MNERPHPDTLSPFAPGSFLPDPNSGITVIEYLRREMGYQAAIADVKERVTAGLCLALLATPFLHCGVSAVVDKVCGDRDIMPAVVCETNQKAREGFANIIRRMVGIPEPNPMLPDDWMQR